MRKPSVFSDIDFRARLLGDVRDGVGDRALRYLPLLRNAHTKSDIQFTAGGASTKLDDPLVFADGFETSDTSAWSVSVP